MGARGWEEREIQLLNENRVAVWEDQKVAESDGTRMYHLEHH